MTLSDDNRYMEAVSFEDVARQYGTPTYCYSKARIEANFKAYASAFSGLSDSLVCFAVKANSNLEMLSVLAALGAGADVVSKGELALALDAGIPADRIVFSGVAKTADEIRFALLSGILQINVESEPELAEIARVAEQLGVTANVALRVNPDIAVDTNEKIATGKAETKFGIPWHAIKPLIETTLSSPHVDVRGLAVHLGSQIQDLTPYSEAFDRVVKMVADLRGMGLSVETLDIGGGLGIDYEGQRTDLPTPADLGMLVRQKLGHLECRIIAEPGRSLVGNAGVLLSRVIYEKAGDDRNFLIVDAGMNDFLRPSMYDAFHQIVPVGAKAGAAEVVYDIVGPVCETGDIFGKQRPMPPMKSGDLICILDAGAYGAVMASTYNARPLPVEVLISGDQLERVDRAPLRRS